MRRISFLISIFPLLFALVGCEQSAVIATEDGSLPLDGGGDVDGGDSMDGGDPCDDAVLDAACTAEGTICGECPPDRCSFCNLLECSGGVWQNIESFPPPDCEDGGAADGGEADGGTMDCAALGESCAGMPCCTGAGLICSGETSNCEMALSEGATCDAADDRCGAGLTCCYPCGIPGCDDICEVTCAPGTPGCSDGCILRP